MKQKCKRFRELKGVVQPICSCGGCWQDYFDWNNGKYHAARLALDEQGEEFVRQAEMTMLIKDHEVVTPERMAWIKAQTERFLKALTFRVRLDEKLEAVA